ncbi:hypothetical protein [Sphingomonas piscis]|uniref:hypothetical protein n=1 Tax=Sphingomonas piscis TaxID=2714943 RepID=UPI001FEA859B|nr:hypothetical protein [Sphingomonas piscis]
MFGEQGADRLDGGEGDDLLSGAEGDDLLTGGTGADTFIFAKSGGADAIADFNVLEDQLLLGEGLSVKSHSIVDANGDGVADLSIGLSSGSVILLGVSSFADVHFG